ncbi:hypothetical protein [Mycolicibacter kumamotonensis]|uniref:DUF732 domain-containing protein n=1 Tax=Mycolicibacter kumamotonensis TaxID=354243 RepID=A0A1B8S9M7_9MYCO|nr:hypothetical protein [Mycolicibacter kumamotonensis]OBY29459.1 hypothetical protein ACT18_22915 [Mycolicibacter kumamotonensis]
MIGTLAVVVMLAPAIHSGATPDAVGDPDYRDMNAYTDMLAEFYGNRICQAIDVNPTMLGLADVEDAMARWWPFLSEADLTDTMNKSIKTHCPDRVSAHYR